MIVRLELTECNHARLLHRDQRQPARHPIAKLDHVVGIRSPGGNLLGSVRLRPDAADSITVYVGKSYDINWDKRARVSFLFVNIHPFADGSVLFTFWARRLKQRRPAAVRCSTGVRRSVCSRGRQFGFHGAKLLNNGRQFPADRRQVILDARRETGILVAGNQTVREHFTESFRQYFGRDAGNESLQLSRAMNPTPERNHNRRRPLATYHVFEASVGGALTYGQVLPLHSVIVIIPRRDSPGHNLVPTLPNSAPFRLLGASANLN
jgi:hypothetical protein